MKRIQKHDIPMLATVRARARIATVPTIKMGVSDAVTSMQSDSRLQFQSNRLAFFYFLIFFFVLRFGYR